MGKWLYHSGPQFPILKNENNYRVCFTRQLWKLKWMHIKDWTWSPLFFSCDESLLKGRIESGRQHVNPQPHHLTPWLGQPLRPLEQVSRPVQWRCQQSLCHQIGVRINQAMRGKHGTQSLAQGYQYCWLGQTSTTPAGVCHQTVLSPQSSIRTLHKPHPGRLLVVCGAGVLSRWGWVPAGPEAHLQQGPAFTQLLALTISHRGRSLAKRVPVLRLPGQAQAQSRQALWAERPQLTLWFWSRASLKARCDMEKPVTTRKAPGNRLSELRILWEQPSAGQSCNMSLAP